MNIFQGSIHRLSETVIVWSVEGGCMLMGHPVHIQHQNMIYNALCCLLSGTEVNI